MQNWALDGINLRCPIVGSMCSKSLHFNWWPSRAEIPGQNETGDLLSLPMNCRIPGQHHILSTIIIYIYYTCIIMYPNVMYPNATLGTWFASVVLNSRLESYCQVWRTSPRFISTKKSIRTGNRKAPAWKSHNENTVANCFCFSHFSMGKSAISMAVLLVLC